MIVYLDANIVIYFVEQNPVWGPKTTVRMATLMAGEDALKGEINGVYTRLG